MHLNFQGVYDGATLGNPQAQVDCYGLSKCFHITFHTELPKYCYVKKSLFCIFLFE